MRCSGHSGRNGIDNLDWNMMVVIVVKRIMMMMVIEVIE
jgi:hypothetical protein